MKPCAHTLVTAQPRLGPKKTPAGRHVFEHVRCRYCGVLIVIRWLGGVA